MSVPSLSKRTARISGLIAAGRAAGTAPSCAVCRSWPGGDLPALAPAADDTVGDHGDQRNGKPGDETEPGIGLAQRLVDLLAEFCRSDHCGDHQHREPGHD